MLNTYNVTEEEGGGYETDPSDLAGYERRTPLKDRLYALNDIRSGYISDALECMGIEHKSWVDEKVPEFKRKNAEKFFAALEGIAKKLKAKGY